MRRSLKFRAALATGLVVAVVIFALAVVAQYYAYLSLKDLLQTQQDTLVKLVAEQLDEKFEGRAIVLRRLARQLAPLLDRSPDELRAFATQAVSIPEAFNAVSLIWPDGELAFNSATPLGQHVSLADRDYVREIVRGASIAVSEPLVGKNNGAPGIVMAVGLRSSDGSLRAIVAGSLNLLRENFLQELTRNRIGATGTFCLISSGDNPRYVMHTDLSNLLKGAKAIGESCEADTAPAALGFIHPKQPIVSHYLLDTNGWELVANFPAAEAYAPLNDVRRKLILAAGIAIALAAVLMWMVSHRLMVPLVRLHGLVQQNARGRLMHSPMSMTTGDEISDLTTTFSEFMRQLAERETALERAKDEARASERRIQAIANHLPDLASYVGRDERYVFVNDAYERRFGLASEQIVGQSIQELWGATAYAEVKPYLDEAFAGASVAFDRDSGDGSECLEVTYQPAWNEAMNTVLGLHIFVRDVTTERLKIRHLEKQVLLDHLTGLLNRKGFDRRLRLAIERASANGRQMALLLIDLDGFKAINDTCGHAVGDQILRTFSERLASCVRESDTVARIGGDEFAIVMEHISNPDAVGRVAQTIIELASAPYALDGHHITAGATVGVALRHPQHDRSIGDLFMQADTALYTAKRGGKGRYVVFSTTH